MIKSKNSLENGNRKKVHKTDHIVKKVTCNSCGWIGFIQECKIMNNEYLCPMCKGSKIYWLV